MSDSNGNGVSRPFTPTEQRILAVLADGQMHMKEPLLLAIDPGGLAERGALRAHMFRIRAKLKLRNETVHCVNMGRGYAYQHVRLLMPAE